ncbi:MAG: 1-(5-phosphoribosyl)-5-[(5-phosphoribosylamino)methylideneamino] imidazole-4-carboxamide isomerase [Dehalococcoidia bacterium]|nr:1-(5-phosphoribosyl)-5-[(5-phosphoribosylamino)methylideneamino] imidazole-4-carboxamide isomerase [Dehalococcoidia bacterium]
MELIPAIDIRGGRCVRLVQGDFARETVFGDDPLALAQRWAGEGATRLHVVDLDAAREGRPVNAAIVARIIAETGVPVEVAGGPRGAADFDRWADAGADRIVTGTLAVEQPDVVEAAARRYPGRIAVAIDARDGRVAVRGWVETSDRTVAAVMRDMAARGIEHFIYTDIRRDGTMQHPDFDAFARVLESAALPARRRPAQETPADAMDDASSGASTARDVDARPSEPSPAGAASHGRGSVAAPVIFGGGITSIEDVARLAADFDIEGVIIGRALYDGRLDLRAAQHAIEARRA